MRGTNLCSVALVAVALAACSGDDDSDDTSEAPTTTTAVVAAGGWDDAALATAEALAQEVRDGGIDCDDYTVDDYASLAADYEGRIPLPLASTHCTGPGGEDLTFEVFADETARANFVATKMQVICTTSVQESIPFPGLPYVEGATWLIEPDEEGTSRALADVVGGGDAKLDTCPTG